MYRRMLIGIFTCGMIFGCKKVATSETNESAPTRAQQPNELPMTPQLRMEAKEGGCLDLQALAEQMGDPRFAYPGFAYTRDFQFLVPPSHDSFRDTLLARSFRADFKTVHALSDLRSVKQTDCSSISMPDAGGLHLVYRIVAFSPTSLELELDQDARSTELASWDDAQRESIKDLPPVRRWTVRAEPYRVELTSVYRAVPMDCPKETGIEAREVSVISWSDSAAGVNSAVDMDAGYWRRLAALALPSSAPVPTPASSEGLVRVEPTTVAALTQTLAARAYVSCH
jgi:hypothetical protein